MFFNVKMEQFKTSLVISTYNWPEALELCLKSSLRQTVAPAEILVADDGSDERTAQLIALLPRADVHPDRPRMAGGHRIPRRQHPQQGDARARTGRPPTHPGRRRCHPPSGFRARPCLRRTSGTLSSAAAACCWVPDIRQDCWRTARSTSIRMEKGCLQQAERHPHPLGIAGLRPLQARSDARLQHGLLARRRHLRQRLQRTDPGLGQRGLRIRQPAVAHRRAALPLKLSGIVYHIYHNVRARDQAVANQVLANLTRSRRLLRCKQGISQYLYPDPETTTLVREVQE